jgi:hypothetical protein
MLEKGSPWQLLECEEGKLSCWMDLLLAGMVAKISITKLIAGP